MKDFKENIVAALESLKAVNLQDSESVPENGRANQVEPGNRGFGAAIEAILRYSGSDSQASFIQARVMAFLAGIPNRGLGKLYPRYNGQSAITDISDPKRVEVEKERERLLLAEQTEIYRALAAQAVDSGISVDLFPCTADYVDLASLKALSVESGGYILQYQSTEEATLPQDLYRMLGRAQASGGVLRLRCSREFRPIRAFGQLFPDAQFEDVFHVSSCDAFGCFAFDLDFDSRRGLQVYRQNPNRLPTLQLAFQYTIFGGDPPGFRRRLLVKTVQVPVAESTEELYQSADTETILAVLTHKVYTFHCTFWDTLY